MMIDNSSSYSFFLNENKHDVFAVVPIDRFAEVCLILVGWVKKSHDTYKIPT